MSNHIQCLWPHPKQETDFSRLQNSPNPCFVICVTAFHDSSTLFLSWLMVSINRVFLWILLSVRHFHGCLTVILLPVSNPWCLWTRVPWHMFPGHDHLSFHAGWLATSINPATPGTDLSLSMATDNVANWISGHCAQEPLLLMGFLCGSWLGTTPESGGNLVPFSGAVGLVGPTLVSPATVCVVWVHILPLAYSNTHSVYEYNSIFTKI